MAATVQTKAGDIVAEMNTAPLIDVMLVLLTLLIITLPMQTNAVKIDLPRQLPPPAQRPQIVTLTVDWDGTTLWNGRAVDHATLDLYLAGAAHREPQDEIHIRPDRLAKYDAVAGVLAQAARSGETQIGFDDPSGQ